MDSDFSGVSVPVWHKGHATRITGQVYQSGTRGTPLGVLVRHEAHVTSQVYQSGMRRMSSDILFLLIISSFVTL